VAGRLSVQRGGAVVSGLSGRQQQLLRFANSARFPAQRRA